MAYDLPWWRDLCCVWDKRTLKQKWTFWLDDDRWIKLWGGYNLKNKTQKKEQSRQFDCVDEHSKWHDPPQVQTKADGTHRPRPRLERDCRRKGERSQPTDFFFFFFFLEKPKRSAVSPQDSTTLGFSKPPPPLYLHYLPRLSFVLLFSSLSLSPF
jgi:hypothetical protein